MDAKLGLRIEANKIRVFIKFIIYSPLLILTIRVLRLCDLHARVPPGSGFSAGTKIVETGLRRSANEEQSENSVRTHAGLLSIPLSKKKKTHSDFAAMSSSFLTRFAKFTFDTIEEFQDAKIREHIIHWTSQEFNNKNLKSMQGSPE